MLHAMKHIHFKLLVFTQLVIFQLIPPQSRAQEGIVTSDTSSIKKKTVIKAVALTAAYYDGSVYALNHTWYKDKDRVAFHFYNDNKGYLQVDKFGHMFGAYVYSYVGYHGLMRMGSSRKEALVFGATLGFLLQFPIEVMDGIHEGYGFSWGDIAANSMGSALVLGQELLFKEQIVKYKFSYWESPYSWDSHGYLGETHWNRLLKDYNGHTYWFSVPLSKILPKSQLPPWLSVAVGYGANGMYGEFGNVTSYKGFPIPETERYRQYLISLDVDWSRIETRSNVLKVIFTGLSFIKFPFPALEYASNGKFRGYWLYM